MIDRKRTACFTGHRSIPENDKAKLRIQLDRIIEALYNKGVVFFGCGGAYGFDTEAEYAVLRAKERHKEIKLILVLPCKGQDKYWNDESKAMYRDILSKADTQMTVCTSATGILWTTADIVSPTVQNKAAVRYIL